MGNMFPTLGKKISDPYLERDRRYGLPRIVRIVLPYQSQGDHPWKNQSVGIFTKLSGGYRSRGVGSCAAKTSCGCHPLTGGSLELMCQIMSTPPETNTPGVAP